MKKSLLALLALTLTTSVVIAQTPNTQTSQINQVVNGKREGYWKITAALEHLTTPWKPTDLVKEGNYKASMMVGMWIAYYQSGKKKSELTYVNNRPNGPAKTYFENGNLQEEGTWVGTRWTGDYTLYYENGSVRQKFKYTPLGVRSGVQEYYHPNGQLAISTNIVNGKEEGWTKYYNDNGELTEENFYAGGVMDPAKTIKHEPKQKVEVAQEDQQEGTSPKVTPGKDKLNIGTFNGNGGPHTLYNPDGFVSMKGTFKDWKLVTGEQYFYGPNGKVTRIKKFENGKYVGDGPLPPDEKVK